MQPGWRSLWCVLGVACAPAGAPDPGGALALAPALAPAARGVEDPALRRARALASPDWGLPPPTEHVLDAGAEQRNKSARKAWIRQKHRAPPGWDTSATERANGLRQVARRAALRRSPPAVAPTARWVERGSDNQAGRVHAARLSAAGDTLYLGSSLGGVWRGDPEGVGWEPIGDNLYGGGHWLEVLDDGGQDVVVVATDGGLVHRSADGGQTWEVPAGLGDPTAVRRMLMLSEGSQTLLLVVNNSAGVKLLRSTDLGLSFDEVADLGGMNGDVWAPRDGQAGLYLLSASGLLFSPDAGDTWTVRSGPSGASRGELTGSEAGAPTLYQVADGARLLRSDDGGRSWVNLGEISDYWGALNASLDDPDLFAFGGVELHRTDDGGLSFAVVNAWWDYYGDPSTLLHADIMGVEVQRDTLGQEVWFIATDGGLYRSLDGLNGVENLSLQGLRVSQYYDTLTSSARPEHIAAGAQDQGYQITNGVEQRADTRDFSQIISGDYGHLTSSDGTHGLVYSVYPGFILVQVGEDDPWLDYLDFPSTAGQMVPWLPPIVADPEDPRVLFFPGERLVRMEYNPMSGAVSEALWSEQDFGASDGEYLSALAFAPSDADRLYAATSAGRLFISADHGISFTQSAGLVPDENWLYGQAIAVDPDDADTLLVGGSGYGVPAVYRSTDGGQSFRPWGQGLPDTLVYSLCVAQDGSGRAFAGTETSVYQRGPEDAAWVDVTDTTAPITIYWSCEVLAAENTIRFGTYGRGIWDYQLDADHVGCVPVQDYDGDGVDCESDCDDHEPAVYPGAADPCDGVDTDCGGEEELDADGDGVLSCADCDDARATHYPGAAEVCGDGLDQDCDGQDTPCDVGGPADSEEPGGDRRCGCASAGPPGGAALLSGALLLLVARRRRGAP